MIRLSPYNLMWGWACQLTPFFMKGIYPRKLWCYNVGFVWCACWWWGGSCAVREPLLLSPSSSPRTVTANFRLFEVEINTSFASNGQWVTGRWQETNVSLHHTRHPHKHSATPGPCSELLIRVWWERQGTCFAGGGITKSTPASSYKVINSVCFSPPRLLPGRTDTFLFSTTLISLWAAGTVDIRGGKWSAWPWRNGSPLGGSDWLPLGERSTWQYLLIHSTTIKLCVWCRRTGVTNGQQRQSLDV